MGDTFAGRKAERSKYVSRRALKAKLQGYWSNIFRILLSTHKRFVDLTKTLGGYLVFSADCRTPVKVEQPKMR